MRRPEPTRPRAHPAVAAATAALAAAVLAGCGGGGGAPPGTGALLVSDRGGPFRVYLVDPADGSARLVGSERADDRSYDDGAPARLPDGRIAFVSNRGGRQAIYLAAAAGGPAASPLFPPPVGGAPAAADTDPAPLGRDRIVFARAAAGRPPGAARDIYLAGADGSAPRRLTHDPADDGAPTGSPDGRSVVFVSDRAGPRRLFLIPDVDAADPEATVIDLSRAAAPAPGSPETARPFADGDPVFLPDGSLLFRRAAEGSPPQIYLMGGTGSRVALRQITEATTLPRGASEPVPQADGTLWFVAGAETPSRPAPTHEPGGKGGRCAIYRVALGGINLSRVTREGAPYDDFTRRLRPPGRDLLGG